MRRLADRAVLGAPLRRRQIARGGGCAVLVYHRVAQQVSDPQLQCVTPDRFAAHMEVVASEFSPIPLGELARRIRAHAPLPRRAVAVTFDDGYADNLVNALPVLRRHEIPATIFVNSAFVGADRLIVVDEIEMLVLRSLRMPASLTVPGLAQPLELGDATGSEPSGWNVTLPASTPRQRAYLALCELVRPLDAAGRERVLNALREQSGERPKAGEDERMLSAEELRSLANDELIEIGAHTSDHLLLSAHTAEVQREQIERDRAALREMTGAGVTLFSYPHGGRADYSDETVRLVRAAGFDAACANHPGVTTPWTDPYRIPRLSVRDIEPSALAARLEERFARGA